MKKIIGLVTAFIILLIGCAQLDDHLPPDLLGSGEGQEYYINVNNPGGNGYVSPGDGHQFNSGDDITLVFHPDAGYEVSALTVNSVNELGALSGIPPQRTFINVDYDLNVNVAFGLIDDNDKEFKITAGTNGLGQITPNGDVFVNQGDDQTFNFTPQDGNTKIDSVVVNGNNIGSPSTYTINNVQEDGTIMVYFGQKNNGVQHSIKLFTSGTGNGVIKQNNSVVTGEFLVNDGDDVTFTFGPDLQSQIAAVWVNDVDMGVRSDYTFTNVTEEQKLEVVFAQKNTSGDSVIISVTHSGNGSTSPSGDTTVAKGSNVEIFFYPDQNYEVGSVLVNSVEQGDGSSIRLDDVQIDFDVQVTYQAIQQEAKDTIDMLKGLFDGHFEQDSDAHEFSTSALNMSMNGDTIMLEFMKSAKQEIGHFPFIRLITLLSPNVGEGSLRNLNEVIIEYTYAGNPVSLELGIIKDKKWELNISDRNTFTAFLPCDNANQGNLQSLNLSMNDFIINNGGVNFGEGTHLNEPLGETFRESANSIGLYPHWTDNGAHSFTMKLLRFELIGNTGLKSDLGMN